MNMFTEANLWIPVVILAAAAQTVRNASQRSLSDTVGTWPATLVRFMYGLPLAVVCLVLLYTLPTQTPQLPQFSAAFLGWLAVGAFFQVGATAALLLAMRAGNFAVSVTFSKTEVLQLMLFGSFFLDELPAGLHILAALIATLAVVLLAWPPGGLRAAAPQENRSPGAEKRPLGRGKAPFYGLLCGASFALASLGYRGAALNLPGVSAWVFGAWGVVLAQAMQTVFVGGWLAWQDREGLMACFRNWRLSMLAGTMGAVASLLWFSAYAMQAAATVRALGMIEVLFGYLVSRRLLHEHLRRAERWGIALVVLAVLIVALPA